MTAPAPLSLAALLSQALVCFTVEFDNEAEHRMPHRTTEHGVSPLGSGPWLVSLAMWETCMRYVGDMPIAVAELARLARTGTNLAGMSRWGYITMEGAGVQQPGPNTLVRATALGEMARRVWQPLPALIETRWRDRFGDETFGVLCDSLRAIVGQADPLLPDCLPILGYGLFSRWSAPRSGSSPTTERWPPSSDTLPLSALLARVLLSFAMEFEHETQLPLAVVANLLRVLDDRGVRVRDLPALTGVSKAAIAMAMGVAEKARLAVTEPDPAGSRWPIARLTPKGTLVRLDCLDLVGTIEERWRARYGGEMIGNLVAALEPKPAGSGWPGLFDGLTPYPDGWRASVRPPATLPHYPMVLHRGGFPDGS